MACTRESLENLLLNEAQMLYNAESQISTFFPQFAKAASSGQLQDIYKKQLEQSKEQLGHLKGMIDKFGPVDSLRSASCIAMNAILNEARNLLTARLEPDALDVELALAAKRVAQYQVSGYQAVKTYATALGHKEEAQRIDKTAEAELRNSDRLAEVVKDLVVATH
jgi:ferritin-like metal-binding protein YciE